jgi:hypothetical protein
MSFIATKNKISFFQDLIAALEVTPGMRFVLRGDLIKNDDI